MHTEYEKTNDGQDDIYDEIRDTFRDWKARDRGYQLVLISSVVLITGFSPTTEVATWVCLPPFEFIYAILLQS